MKTGMNPTRSTAVRPEARFRGQKPDGELSLGGTAADIRARVHGQRATVRRKLEAETAVNIRNAVERRRKTRLRQFENNLELLQVAALSEYASGITGKMILQALFARNLGNYRNYKNKVQNQVENRQRFKKLLGWHPRFQNVPATQRLRYMAESNLMKHLLPEFKPGGCSRRQTEQLHRVLKDALKNDLNELVSISSAGMSGETIKVTLRPEFLKAMIWEHEGRPEDAGSLWLIDRYPVERYNSYTGNNEPESQPDPEATYLIENGQMPFEAPSSSR